MPDSPNATEVRLYPEQGRFVLDTHKFSCFIGGRGSGKSYAGCVKDIIYAWDHPGARGYVTAPTFGMLRDNTLLTFMELLPRPWLGNFNRQNLQLDLVNGSTVFFRSLENPDRARGPSLAFFHCDELAYSQMAAWIILKATLRQPTFPVQGWGTTTPRRRNFVYAEFAPENLDDDHAFFHATSRDNPHLPEDYTDFAKGQSEEYRLQEVEGLFVGVEGLVYKSFARQVHVGQPPAGLVPRRTIAGVDWGFRDPAVIVVIQDFGEWGLYQPAEWRKVGVTVDEQAAAARELAAKYNIRQFYCDPSRPDSIETLKRKGLPVTEANNDIITGIQAVTQYLALDNGQPRYHVHPSCVSTIDEFEVYAYPDAKPDRNPSEVPVDKDNHSMDSTRYALRALWSPTSSVIDFYRRKNLLRLAAGAPAVPVP